MLLLLEYTRREKKRQCEFKSIKVQIRSMEKGEFNFTKKYRVDIPNTIVSKR